MKIKNSNKKALCSRSNLQNPNKNGEILKARKKRRIEKQRAKEQAGKEIIFI